MGNPWFQFRQFRILQEKSALRVGTDGVLLGAWCNVNGVKRILDVGTGTGVIALMLAQRTEEQSKLMPDAVKIDAVEISAGACEDASANFLNSPWQKRLTLHQADFRQFDALNLPLLDLIVSNPPFFKNSLRSADHSSSVARHDTTLTREQLVTGARRLLAPEGRLAVVIPADAFGDFRETARLAGFYLARKTMVIPKLGKPAKRVLLEFSLLPCYPVTGELIVLLRDDCYSNEFLSLTGDFYLKSP